MLGPSDIVSALEAAGFTHLVWIPDSHLGTWESALSNSRLRPIRPDDAQLLVDFYDRVSPESKYLRFFAPYPRLSARDVARFTQVDYVDRVALILTVGGDMIGNPISFGLPAALLFLLSIAENGRWIMVKDNPVWRGALTGLSGMALLLSTSRGSWLLAIAGLIIIFVFDKKQRPSLILYMTALLIVTAVFTQKWQYKRNATAEPGPQQPCVSGDGQRYLPNAATGVLEMTGPGGAALEQVEP